MPSEVSQLYLWSQHTPQRSNFYNPILERTKVGSVRGRFIHTCKSCWPQSTHLWPVCDRESTWGHVSHPFTSFQQLGWSLRWNLSACATPSTTHWKSRVWSSKIAGQSVMSTINTTSRANYLKILLTSPNPVPGPSLNHYFRRHIFIQLFHYLMANWLPVLSLCKISLHITPPLTFSHTYTCTDQELLHCILKQRTKES